ncbi:transglutaminase superfamily protein [Scopulibacillus darangshiensis]|uniref:Transglutaminase superfamily protein n=1 Tax=Scopulibacillus darangshiensis TaxID=442528 RepID=A0A4R2NQF1_9BACL|nr:transglutaminase domain-containing protein [Scopulibacillus darangshiensis]TCP24089.1 transglutaminase superfamily protein [Scopulibacillus darangshiensis]
MRQVKSKYYSLLLYLLGFMLFWEWLRPISEIAHVNDTYLFLFFTAFCFILSYMRWPLWLTFPMKFVAMLFCLHTLFFINSSIINVEWLIYVVEDTIKNISFMFYGNWEGLSDLFRTFLFFVLLWLVSFLMHHWLIQTRRLFLFFFITVFYLAVIDTFTLYHADQAIVRTIVIGLVLLGLLRIASIQERENVTFERGRLPISLFVTLAVTILLASVVGYAAPKTGPQWPDPVPFIKKAANGYGDKEEGGGQGVQTIGYDEDDTHLGGPFQMDDTPIFDTITKESTYWRVESKSVYTGKGWESAEDDKINMDKTPYNRMYAALDLYGKGVKTKDVKADISFKGESFPQLLYDGELEKVTGIGGKLILNQITGKIEPMKVSRHITPKNYTLTYQYPTFSVGKLKSITDDSHDPDSVKERYLQLPKSLPERVNRLALDITKGETNRYAKANSIADYFATGDYEYNTKDVAVPKGGQDYVDQFLFESKRGYCDNFSSSMVVMLRTLGIPARWVKGFTQGEYKDATEDGRFKFEIKNSDAHSWVEAYFPGSGWVPFEPTKGFNNIYSFDHNSDTDASKASAAVKGEPKSKPEPKKEQPVNKETDHNSSTLSLKDQSLKAIVLACIAFTAAILIIAAVFYKTRKKWLPKVILRRYRYRKDKDAFEKAYVSLMKLLNIYGIKKEDNQTLREYAYVVDRKLDTRNMRDLTLDFERQLYGNQQTKGQWLQSKELWENIIKKLQA